MLSLFASCGGGNGDSTTAGDDIPATDAPVTTGRFGDDGPNYLPEETYEGASFVALMSGNGNCGKFNDFASESQSGSYTVVAESIAARNAKVEELFDITFSYVEDFGADRGSNRIKEDFAAGESSYNICHIQAYEAATLALSDFLYDINSLPHMDLKQSWWDQDVNDDMVIHGKLFFTTGEISLMDNLATHAILFNKEIAQEKNITDMYQLVESEKWTFDKFAEYTKGIADDVDGNDKMDENDLYAILTWNDAIQATIAGSDIKIGTVNSDNELVLSLYSDKAVTLLEDFSDVFFDRNSVYNYTAELSSSEYDRVRDSMFNENRALFYCTTCHTVSRHRDTETDFGILPYPKNSEEQERYGSNVGISYSVMMCVEKYSEDLDFTGVITEAMAYLGEETVTPVYYERTLKGTYVRDDESALCLDLIFGNRCFDPGIYFRIGDYTGRFTDMMKTRRNYFDVMYKSYLEPAEQRLAELNEVFENWSE